MSLSCVLFVPFVMALFLPVPVYAQTASPSATATPIPLPESGMDITLSPVTIQLVTKPGESIRSEIKIRNNGPQTEEYSLAVVPFEADASGSKPLIREARESDIHLQWVQLEDSTIRVGPGEWKTVPFVFAPPEQSALSYYFALQVRRRTADSPSGATAIAGAPAVLVLSTVESPFARRELVLEQVQAEQSFLEFLPSRIAVTIKNTGNVHASPQGDIFIDSGRRKDIAVLPLNPTRLMILPGTSRTFLVEWSDGFPVFTEDAKGGRKLTWDFSRADRLRMGRFTAHVLMVYDDGTRDVPSESSVGFWVVPLRILLGALLIPTLPAFVVFISMRVWMRRRARRSDGIEST